MSAKRTTESVRLTEGEHQALIDAADAEFVVWEREPIVVAVERIVADRLAQQRASIVAGVESARDAHRDHGLRSAVIVLGALAQAIRDDGDANPPASSGGAA